MVAELHYFFCLPHMYSITGNSRPSSYPRKNALHNGGRTRKVSCSISTQGSNPVNERKSANYQPPIWSYSSLQSINNASVDEIYKDEAKKLEEEVRSMMNNEDVELLTILEMIDDIQRLGLSRRFEKDIKRNLDRIFPFEACNFKTKNSLHATALCFRLLRQHGYHVSQDAFEKYMDENGNLMASLLKDIKGMLSLYEASNLAYKGEDILHKALAQTRTQLKNFQGSTNLEITERVNHALDLPLHHRMLMLEARWYIEAYVKRKDANRVLLELAKLDFNMVQSVFQRDLQEALRWWNDLGLANKLSFSRDRLMECFFWTVGMVSEPQFSSCRTGLTKVTSLITTIDDVYDVYGTLNELELFTKAVERWDVNAVRDLPGCMKLCFLALYNTVNEMGYEHLKEHEEDVIPILRKAAFLQEADWNYNKFTPSSDDYLENAWRSVSGTVILIHAYFLLDQRITKPELDCLVNYHDLLRWPSVIFRLCNDLGTSSAELIRGETANAISCYMCENNVSEEQARKHINHLIDEAWKKMNKQQIDKSPFAKTFRDTAINLARIAHCTYQHGDGHGAPDARSKNSVMSVIIEPISMI